MVTSIGHLTEFQPQKEQVDVFHYLKTRCLCVLLYHLKLV